MDTGGGDRTRRDAREARCHAGRLRYRRRPAARRHGAGSTAGRVVPAAAVPTARRLSRRATRRADCAVACAEPATAGRHGGGRRVAAEPAASPAGILDIILAPASARRTADGHRPGGRRARRLARRRRALLAVASNERRRSESGFATPRGAGRTAAALSTVLAGRQLPDGLRPGDARPQPRIRVPRARLPLAAGARQCRQHAVGAETLPRTRSFRG